MSGLQLWGNGKDTLTFQGICDVIGVDNDALQLQFRTRRGRSDASYSGVTEIAVKWKPTNTTLFQFEGDKRMVVDNISSHSSDVKYSIDQRSNGFNIHTFQFVGATNGDNYIKIEENPYGLHNIQIKGFGKTFGGSRGMIGAWNRWDAYPRLEMRKGWLYYGYDAVTVAKSWNVGFHESLFGTPSSICESEYPCGPGLELECYEDMYMFGSQNRQQQCSLTCDDIENPRLRMFCKQDVALTGYDFWP